MWLDKFIWRVDNLNCVPWGSWNGMLISQLEPQTLTSHLVWLEWNVIPIRSHIPWLSCHYNVGVMHWRVAGIEHDFSQTTFFQNRFFQNWFFQKTTLNLHRIDVESMSIQRRSLIKSTSIRRWFGDYLILPRFDADSISFRRQFVVESTSNQRWFDVDSTLVFGRLSFARKCNSARLIWYTSNGFEKLIQA